MKSVYGNFLVCAAFVIGITNSTCNALTINDILERATLEQVKAHVTRHPEFLSSYDVSSGLTPLTAAIYRLRDLDSEQYSTECEPYTVFLYLAQMYSEGRQLSNSDKLGQTPLGLALSSKPCCDQQTDHIAPQLPSYKEVAIAQALLLLGASADTTTVSIDDQLRFIDSTPLHVATDMSNSALFSSMCQTADMTACDEHGRTVFELIVENQNIMNGDFFALQALQALQLHKFDFNAPIKKHGMTPFMHVIQRCIHADSEQDTLFCHSILQKLINFGIDINHQEYIDGKLTTPLLTALNTDLPLVKFLLGNGACTHEGNRDEQGHYAIHLIRDETLAQLEKFCTIDPCDEERTQRITDEYEPLLLTIVSVKNCSLTNNAGDTPLHTAACGSQAAVVRKLRSLGAELTTTNKSGHTPLFCYMQSNCMDKDGQTLKALLEDNHYQITHTDTQGRSLFYFLAQMHNTKKRAQATRLVMEQVAQHKLDVEGLISSAQIGLQSPLSILGVDLKPGECASERFLTMCEKTARKTIDEKAFDTDHTYNPEKPKLFWTRKKIIGACLVGSGVGLCTLLMAIPKTRNWILTKLGFKRQEEISKKYIQIAAPAA